MASQWMEALPVIRAGAGQLKIGEMVHTRHFQLAEVISAVEIGDPRMDFPIDESLQVDAQIAIGNMPLNQSLRLQLAVVDGLICRLAQWWRGVTLLQTLYTSLHMLARDKVQGEPFLGPVCEALTGIISVCKSLILESMVVEEEDCPIFSPGVPEEVSPSKEQMERISTLLTSAVETGTVADGSPEELAAMRERLVFLKHVFLGLCEVQLGVSAEACQSARTHFEAARVTLASVRESAACAAPGEPDSFVPRLHVGAWALPPPPVKPPSPAEAFDELAAAMTQLGAACTVIQVASLPALKSFLTQFLDGRVSAIARAALHTQLATRDSQDDAHLPAWAPSVAMIARDVFFSSATVSQAEDVRMFVEQAQLATGNLIQALCMNKARVHRRLRTRLEDYANLYTHAFNADTCQEMPSLLASLGWDWPSTSDPAFPPGPCTMWVEREVSVCMLQHLLMGFELNLYSESEFFMIFWYCDYLLSIVSTATRNIHRLRPKEKRTTVKKKGKSQPSESVLTQEEVLRMSKEQLMLMSLESLRALCQGTLRLSVALQRAGLMPLPEHAFGSAVHRFDQRFESFQNVVAPPPLNHDCFVRSTDASELSVMQLLDLPLESFKNADELGRQIVANASYHKDMLSEWEVKNVQARCLVAKRNWFASTILVKAFRDDEDKAKNLTVKWEFASHKHFPTLAVKTS